MDRRDIVISFRVNTFEAQHIKEAGLSLKNYRSIADFSRASVLHQAGLKVPPPTKPLRIKPRQKPNADTEALARILAQLGKIGSNINQVAKIANSTGQIADEVALRELAEQVAQTCIDVASALSGGAPDHEDCPHDH